MSEKWWIVNGEWWKLKKAIGHRKQLIEKRCRAGLQTRFNEFSNDWAVKCGERSRAFLARQMQQL